MMKDELEWFDNVSAIFHHFVLNNSQKKRFPSHLGQFNVSLLNIQFEQQENYNCLKFEYSIFCLVNQLDCNFCG